MRDLPLQVRRQPTAARLTVLKECLDYCSPKWLDMFCRLDGAWLLLDVIRSHEAPARWVRTMNDCSYYKPEPRRGQEDGERRGNGGGSGVVESGRVHCVVESGRAMSEVLI